MNDTTEESTINPEELKNVTIEDLKKLSEGRRTKLREANSEIEKINVDMKMLSALVETSKNITREISRIGGAIKNLEGIFSQRDRYVKELHEIHKRLVEISEKGEDVLLKEETRKLIDRTRKMIRGI